MELIVVVLFLAHPVVLFRLDRKIMKRFRCVVVLLCLGAASAQAQTLPSGVIDVPGTYSSVGDNQSIGSNTTLNVTGSSVGRGFEAGTRFGANTSTLVNVSGGRIGNSFIARANAEVNVSGGTIGIIFAAGDGSTVNITGGDFGAFFYAGSGSEVNISGGTFARAFRAKEGSLVSFLGGDFLVNGSMAAASVTLGPEDVLTGTLEDGSTFVFSPVAEDEIEQVQLVSRPLPTLDTTPLVVSDDSGPRGLRPGQTLTLLEGGELGPNFAADDATVVIEGGVVRSGFEAARSQVTISGGSIESLMHVYSGSIVTIAGDATTDSVYAYAGSEVNVEGGAVGAFTQIHAGSRFQISGGTVGSYLEVLSGGELHISGGTIGGSIEQQLNSDISLYGGDFRLNGTPVTGNIAFSVGSSDTLTGTLEDGSPFVFSELAYDQLRNVTLAERPLPAIDLTPITVAAGTGPSGLRQGQSLKMQAGGMLPDNFTATGANIEVVGGTIGESMELVETTLNLAGGTIEGGLAVYMNSRVDVSGGNIGAGLLVTSGSQLDIRGGDVGGTDDSGVGVRDGGVVNISGGTVGEYFYADSGGRVNISGGTVAGQLFHANSDSVVNILGGALGQSFTAFPGSVVNISGGSQSPNFDAAADSQVNLLGTQFVLDGVDITSTLSEGTPLSITDRDVTLSGVLADGSAFSFDLNSSGSYYTSVFAPNAQLTVSLFAGSLIGDYNGDDIVNLADYAVWRNTLGQIGRDLVADGNHNNMIDAGDYEVWRLYFGKTAGGGTTLATEAIPEASSGLLLGIAMACLLVRRSC